MVWEACGINTIFSHSASLLRTLASRSKACVTQQGASLLYLLKELDRPWSYTTSYYPRYNIYEEFRRPSCALQRQYIQPMSMSTSTSSSQSRPPLRLARDNESNNSSSYNNNNNDHITATDPPTPLSPFPTTPHRLSSYPYPYLTRHNGINSDNNDGNNDDDDDDAIAAAAATASPSKALALTRLNHEMAALGSWLDGLFAPAAVPPHLLRWKGEVFAAAAQGNSDMALVGSGGRSSFGHGDRRGVEGGRGFARAGTAGRSVAGSGNDVLEALNELKQVNLSADHLASLVHGARCEELRDLEEAQRQEQLQRDDGFRARLIMDEVYARLGPEAIDALRNLSETAVALGLDLAGESAGGLTAGGGRGGDMMKTAFLRAILRHADRKFVLDDQVHELGVLQSQIDNQMSCDTPDGTEPKIGRGEEDTLVDYQSEHLNAETARLNRDTKQINLKIMEYQDRLASLERQLVGLRRGSNSLADVLNARARVEDRRARVRALQERFAAFNGLPPDLEDSRNEVRRAMAELDALKRRRDALFERMGNG